MLGFEFDFARYVAERKGEVQRRARDGSAYAYSGERRVRRALASTRPVTMAIEATTRLWKSRARKELLDRSTKATDQNYPAIDRAAKAAGKSLGLTVPAVYVTDNEFPQASATLGTDEDPVIVVRKDVTESLDDKQLIAAIGYELGHVQNNQVILTTALFYLRHEAMFFVRWIVQPAVIALSSWSRRADITCDRASLIASRDLDATLAALVFSTMGDTGDESPREVLARLGETKRGVSKLADWFRDHPHLDKRARSVEMFADTGLYKKLTGVQGGGMSGEELDNKVTELLRVFA